MAHLHALLARESTAAVLIKRGPGKQSCTIGWERRDDTFQLGQWLRQRLDHRDADLSPDGKYLVYWVQTHRWGQPNHAYRVVSQAPWLKALTFWGAEPRGLGPGTALFFRDARRKLCLFGGAPPASRDRLGLAIVSELPDELRCYAVEGESRHFLRLRRDGWQPLTPWGPCPEAEAAGAATWRPNERPWRIVFERPLLYGWRLRRTSWTGLHNDADRGVAWEAFALVSPHGEIMARPEWQWADADLDRYRLVWTERAAVFAARLSAGGLGEPAVLFDTSTMGFERRVAPY